MSCGEHPAQAIEVAAELYHTRAVVRRFYRDKFRDVMAKFGSAIKIVAAREKVSELKAAKTIAQAANEQGDGMAAACFLAAYVELVEPTPEGHSDLVPLRGSLNAPDAAEVLLV